ESLKRHIASSRATLYPIALARGLRSAGPRAASAAAVLHELAALTGGEVFEPKDAKDLPGIFERILAELSTQYVLGFVSDDPRRDDRYRKLEVEVKRPGVRLRHRRRYLPAARDKL